MYNSPIHIIQGQLETQPEGEVLRAVQRYGVSVDKEELIKALEYDRGQYKNGYLDGRGDALETIIHCKECRWRGDDCHCPMCFEEERTYDDGDGYMEVDYVTLDRTVDDGFCDRGERSEEE